jgi:type I restriction enzyme S subunit
VSRAYPTARLSEIAWLNPVLDAKLDANAQVAFVPMAAVSATTAAVESVVARPYGEVSKGYTAFKDGDVLLAKITPCFENGKIAQAQLPVPYGFGSTEFHVVRPRAAKTDARYLLHYLRQDNVRADGARRMTGSGGQRRVPASFLSELQVPLPPLAEQRRIAAILDQAEALRAQRRAAIAQLDSLGQAIFLEMFGDVCANDRGWPADKALGDVADIASGVTKGRNLHGKAARLVPYLAVANVQDKSLKLEGVKSIEATGDEIRRYRLHKNDLLLTEGGDPDKLGRGTLWNDELPEAIHQNHIFRVRVTSSEVTPLFLNWLVGSQRGKQYFLRSAKQTTGIASINMTQLRGFPLLLPPIAVQEAFAGRVQAVEKLKITHRTALARLDELFISLQHRAFRGELTARAVSVEQFRPLESTVGLEALIFVAKRMPAERYQHYKSLKALYFADKHHLKKHGRLIYGETHCALPHGPVPQAAYDATRVLNGERLISDFDDEALRAGLRRIKDDQQDKLVALRDADFSKLGAVERESLEWAIRYCAGMSFEQVKAASHDAAYGRTSPNQPIPLAYLIDMLPADAQGRQPTP